MTKLFFLSFFFFFFFSSLSILGVVLLLFFCVLINQFKRKDEKKEINIVSVPINLQEWSG